MTPKSDAWMTDAEHGQLAGLETTIEKGLDRFREVGQALLTIRDGRLYRAEYKSFEEYCRQRWKFGRSRAHRLIEASVIAESVLPMGDIIQNERQARELKDLDPKERAAILKQAAADGTAPTAARLRELTQKALSSLSPDEQREVIEHEERKALAGAPARQVGGEQRGERVKRCEALLGRLKKITAGFGPEAEEGLEHLEQYGRWLSGLAA